MFVLFGLFFCGAAASKAEVQNTQKGLDQDRNKDAITVKTQKTVFKTLLYLLMATISQVCQKMKTTNFYQVSPIN